MRNGEWVIVITVQLAGVLPRVLVVITVMMMVEVMVGVMVGVMVMVMMYFPESWWSSWFNDTNDVVDRAKDGDDDDHLLRYIGDHKVGPSEADTSILLDKPENKHLTGVSLHFFGFLAIQVVLAQHQRHKDQPT